jgi:uncharacterized membrane protein
MERSTTGRGLAIAPGRRATIAVCLLIACAGAFYAWLAVLRHETFGTSAMDLGYTDQVVWNTVHGRLLRFSTLENASIDLPLERFRRTDILLAYHVELLLVPLSLLYLVFASPVTLLVVQAVGVSLGAWPAFRLAREHLGSDLAGVVFALAYLIAPAIEGAILSDFHAVSLAAPLLLLAFYYAEKRQFALCSGILLVAMSAKEDISLVVLCAGLYLLAFRKANRAGPVLAGAGLLWFLTCMLVILPAFNGLGGSPFRQRLAIFGPTFRESTLNALHQPGLILAWLRQPAIVSYLAGLLSSGGFMSLFAPAILAVAAPLGALNVFSAWSWTYSGGAHYSVAILPIVIVSAIYGLANVRDALARWLRVPPAGTTAALSLLVLVTSAWQHHQIGVSPLARTFRPPHVTAHDRLGKALIKQIPARAPLSAQSNLYPHLAHREKAYLFPAVNDAEYVLLDVTSTPYPLDGPGLYLAAQELLHSGEFGVLAAQDGYLLLERGLASGADGELPASFYTFARVDGSPVPHITRVRFGDALELVGYEYEVRNVVQARDLPVTITTYWRALKPLETDYRFSFFFTGGDGTIVFHYDQGTPTTYWYEPRAWPVDSVVRMQTPALGVGRLQDVLVAVGPPDEDPWRAASRLRPEPVAGQQVALADQDTLVKLFAFPAVSDCRPLVAILKEAER